MSQKNLYPALPPGLETRLGAIVVAARGAKGYLEDSACPYSEEMKSFLKLMLGGAKRERVKVETEELDEGADKYDKMIAEIQSTIDEMASIEEDLEGGDTADRIQFVKAKTILVEKWVNIKERIYNVREIAEFQSILIRTLDAVLTKDQRFAFIEALRALRTTIKAAGELEKVENS